MAGPLRIFVDTQNRKLSVSFTNSATATFPTLVQGEQPTINLYFEDPSNATPSTPYQYIDFSTATVKLGIIAGAPTGGSDTLIAYQDTWTPITNGLEASLDCDTTEIATALAGIASKGCTVEIEVTESGGFPVKYYQGDMTIKAAVIDNVPSGADPAQSFYTKVEADNKFVPYIGIAGMTVLLVSPDGTKAREIGCDDSGAFINNLIDPYTP